MTFAEKKSFKRTLGNTTMHVNIAVLSHSSTSWTDTALFLFRGGCMWKLIVKPQNWIDFVELCKNSAKIGWVVL